MKKTSAKFDGTFIIRNRFYFVNLALGVFLLMASMAYAEESSISDFSGGLNTSDPSFRVAPGFSPYMRNVFVDDGKLEGIKGFQILGTTNTLNKVTGIYPFVRDSGQTTFLVTDSSVTLETSDFITYTFVSSGSNSGALLIWTQFREKMWGYNGIDFVRTWDGTTAKRLGHEANTPNVPKFKVAAYYQERVFGLNNPSGASDLDWSDVASTDGAKIQPDDYRAWPATNNRPIGEGDGQLGTALFVQDGQLRIGKERSIYTLYGTNSSNYVARKEENIGDGVASQESVVSLDGELHWVGQDGIYKNGRRISDLVEDEAESISKGSISTLENTWDTQSQFAEGQFFGTTATAEGILRPRISQSIVSPVDANGGAFTGFSIPGNAIMDSGTTFYGPIRVNFTDNLDNGARFFTRCIDLASINNSGGVDPDPRVGVYIYNLFTELVISTVVHVPNTVGTIPTFCFFPVASVEETTVIFEGDKVNQSSYAIKFEHTNTGDTSETITVGFGSSWKFWLGQATTGQYISDVATNTTISAWGLFDSIRSNNGGTIDYYVRSATTPFNISTQTWKPISPGSYVGEPLQNRFVQWAATITSVSSFTNVTNIDDVVIAHIEGVGSHNRPFAMNWKNRYWLATSTTSSDELSFIMVKSKITNKNPDAWMPIEGANVRAFAKNNDVFYAGASTWGAFYRMDYGTSFGGKAIRFVYDTPDQSYGSFYKTKNIKKYYLDAERDSGLSYDVMSSINMGDYTTKTISHDGTGRQRTIIKGVTNPAKTLRVRLTHSQLDKLFMVYDFTTEYDMTGIIE